MGAEAKPLDAGKGRPQGRALAFPQDQNKGVSEKPNQDQKGGTGPQGEQAPPEGRRPPARGTPKEPREGTPKGGEQRHEVAVRRQCTGVLASPRLWRRSTSDFTAGIENTTPPPPV